MGGLGSAGRASRSGAPFHEQQSTRGAIEFGSIALKITAGAGEGIRTIRAGLLDGAAAKDSEGSIALKIAAGAGEGIRTLDPNLGKVVLYP